MRFFVTIILLTVLIQPVSADVQEEASSYLKKQEIKLAELSVKCQKGSVHKDFHFEAFFGPGYLHAFSTSENAKEFIYLSSGSPKPNCLIGYWDKMGDKKPRKLQACSKDFKPELSFFRSQDTPDVWVPEKFNNGHILGNCEIELGSVLEDTTGETKVGETKVGSFWLSQNLKWQLDALSSLYKNYEFKKNQSNALVSKAKIFQGKPKFKDFSGDLEEIDRLLEGLQDSPETRVASASPDATTQVRVPITSDKPQSQSARSDTTESDSTQQHPSPPEVKSEQQPSTSTELGALNLSEFQNEDFAQLLEDIKKFIVSGAEVDLVVVSEKFDAAQHSANISMKQEAFGELISYLTKQSDFEDFYISLAEDREKQRAKAMLDARSKVENQISELQEYIRNNFGSAKV